MTDEQKTYPDTRDGLIQMLLDHDAGFALYKTQHWTSAVRDVVGPWLDEHDENVRTASLDDRERQLMDRTPPHEMPTDAHARLDAALNRGGTFYRGWLHDLRTVLGYTDGPQEFVRHEHRAVYPAKLEADSAMTARVLDAEDAEARVEFLNRRLAEWGLPTVAHVESRSLHAAPWPEPAPRPY